MTVDTIKRVDSTNFGPKKYLTSSPPWKLLPHGVWRRDKREEHVSKERNNWNDRLAQRMKSRRTENTVSAGNQAKL